MTFGSLDAIATKLFLATDTTLTSTELAKTTKTTRKARITKISKTLASKTQTTTPASDETTTPILKSSTPSAFTKAIQTTTTTASTLSPTKAITTTSTTTRVSTSCVGHYWPVANKAVDDVIGHHSAESNGSPKFTTDRFGLADEALRIYNNVTAWRLPRGRYVKGDTTITMWIKKIECNKWAPYGNFILFLFDDFNLNLLYLSIHKSIVCFGTVVEKTNVCGSSYSDCSDHFEIRDINNIAVAINQGIKVPVDSWYHLAYVYEETTVEIYVNGTLSRKNSDFVASSAIKTFRESNFIGMGEFSNKQYYVSNIVLDEIKLFNKALTREQVLLDMNAVNGIASGIC
jgi:hypothetical protein